MLSKSGMSNAPSKITPAILSQTVQAHLDQRLEEIAPCGDWSRCNQQFSWCGDLFDFLVEGIEKRVAQMGVTFREAYPGPLKLWDEDQATDGTHVRRFWTMALEQGCPIAKLCTFFFHRHDTVALPRPPQVVAFPPDHPETESDDTP